MKPNPVIDGIRRAKGLTVAREAFDLGLDASQAGRLNKGLWTPQDPARRKKIARYFNVDESLIFPGLTPATETGSGTTGEEAESC